MNDMEERLERREAIALKLAEQLNAKIDECEALKFELERQKNIVRIMSERTEESVALKEEVVRLNNLINSMELTVNIDKWVREQ